MPKGVGLVPLIVALHPQHGVHLQLGMERVYAPILGWLLQGCVYCWFGIKVVLRKTRQAREQLLVK